MKRYILISMLPTLLMTSCIDTSVLPVDQITGDDFWKSKAEVTNMVTDVYKHMCAETAVERYLVWGNFRSDEMAPYTGNLGGKLNALKDISEGSMTSTNTYADWSSMYDIINRCNMVLEKAPAVISNDPAYTQETYWTDESQMLGIRALCHFYLIRAFRDIHYSTTAYMNSSTDMNVSQEAPIYTLEKCINDLNKALEHPLSSTAYSDWRRVGLLNRDGIKAILADVYLWRASMTHNQDDYRKCADLCQEIIDSKIEQRNNSFNGGSFGPWGGGSSTTTDQKYPLLDGEYAYAMNFINGNSSESVFELQMDGTSNSNNGMRNLFWNYDEKNNRPSGFVKAPVAVFGNAGDVNSAYATKTDYRFYENVYDAGGSNLTEMSIRKMVSLTNLPNTANNFTSWKADNSTPGRNGNITQVSQNHIFYRLTDVMLMKAEALVQLDGQENLDAAFELVYEVNKRSVASEADYLAQTAYITQGDYEKLVLDERRRELCFEGKRWFDLLRYNYRHVEGIRPDLMLWEISGGSANKNAFVKNYAEMMTLVQLRYTEGGAAKCSKINWEPYLYFPVLENEFKVNANLHQNPVYSSNDMYVKN